MTIEDKVIDAINLAWKSVLCSKEETWVKRGENLSFDVAMGSFDGAEICEIIGIYLLEKLSPLLILIWVGANFTPYPPSPLLPRPLMVFPLIT